jgi:hypothetical protein
MSFSHYQNCRGSTAVMSDSSLSVVKDIVLLLPHVDSSSSSKTQRIESVSHSLVFRALILVQILACGSYSVLVHLCERNGSIEFSSTTMNFILELIKFLFSIGALTCSIPMKHTTTTTIQLKREELKFWLRQSLPYSIPSLLYFINNNLAVHMQLHMDPASYQIFSTFKILTTAIIYRLVIKQKLKRQQWFALSLLSFGGLFYSIGIVIIKYIIWLELLQK